MISSPQLSLSALASLGLIMTATHMLQIIDVWLLIKYNALENHVIVILPLKIMLLLLY